MVKWSCILQDILLVIENWSVSSLNTFLAFDFRFFTFPGVQSLINMEVLLCQNLHPPFPVQNCLTNSAFKFSILEEM